MRRLLKRLREMVLIEINGHDERGRKKWLDLLRDLDDAANQTLLHMLREDLSTSAEELVARAEHEADRREDR